MFFWMSANFFMPVLPLYYHKLGLNDHQVGLAVGAFSVGSVLFRIFSGKAVDRYGSRPVLTVGIVLSVGAIIGYNYAVSIYTAVLMRFIHGVGISGYAAAALTLVTLMHEKSHTTQAVAAYTLFTMFGVGIAASSAYWLFNLGDILAVVIAGATATVLLLVLFPRNPPLKITPVPKTACRSRKLPSIRGFSSPRCRCWQLTSVSVVL